MGYTKKMDRSWLNEKTANEFIEDGYVVVDGLLTSEELEGLRKVCSQLLSNEINASSHRHDLGGFQSQKVQGKENICQIMWPSTYVSDLKNSAVYEKALKLSKHVLGDDMQFDFDMIIAKEAHTDTVTPPHQDESYWPDLPDKRAVTVWIALDNTTRSNGCMWFIPKSHIAQVRPHQASGGKHALSCEADMDDFIPAQINAGSCTLHHGRTVHYSRGNQTDNARRAFIMNFRPELMIKMEREQGFDHGLNGVKNVIGNTNVHKKDDGK